MKKFFGVAAMLMATVAFFSCDPAESEFKYDYYFDNIYTVNKNKLYPEFSDSSIIVPNVDKFGLETGHRAHLVLRNYYDYSTMKAPKWEIATLVDVIPTLPLQVLDSADAAGYNTVFTTLNSYELMDRFVQPVWVWNKLQNINVSFIGKRIYSCIRYSANSGAGRTSVPLGSRLPGTGESQGLYPQIPT